MPTRVPCVAISEEFDVRWHGRYTYEEFCQDGEKIFEVYRAAILHFGYDWALVQIDDCFEFEPIGVGVKGEGSIVRGTYRYLPVGNEALRRVRALDPYSDGRMPEKLDAIHRLKEYFGDSLLVTGSCAAPFSAVGLMLFGPVIAASAIGFALVYFAAPARAFLRRQQSLAPRFFPTPPAPPTAPPPNG